MNLSSTNGALRHWSSTFFQLDGSNLSVINAQKDVSDLYFFPMVLEKVLVLFLRSAVVPHDIAVPQHGSLDYVSNDQHFTAYRALGCER
mgnify:CR=1 FL=1